MRPQDLIINMDAMAKRKYLAIEVSENHPYINGVKSTKQDGFKTTCVLPNLKYEKLIVKTPNGVAPVIPLESEIPAGGLPVSFENLVVTAYISDGRLGLSARADSIALVTPPVSAKS